MEPPEQPKQFKVEINMIVEVRDEIALREAAFHAMRAIADDPRTLGVATSGDAHPAEFASLDAQQALVTLIQTAFLDLPGAMAIAGGSSIGPYSPE